MIISKKTIEGIEVAEIESSNISRSYYTPSSNELIIEFKKGGKYAYKPVSVQMYERFLKAESQGKYFLNEIKNNPSVDFNKV